MNKLRMFLFLFICIVGCATTQHPYTTHPTRSINAYRYVLVPKCDNDPYGTQFCLASMFSNQGFIVLNENSVKKLQLKDSNKVLYCRYQWKGGNYSTFYLELRDPFVDETIYTSKGQSGLGCCSMGMGGNVINALKQAFSGIEQGYSGFSERHIIFPDWENIEIDEEETRGYFDENSENLNPIEGIWISDDNNYTVAILRDTSSTNRDFVAIVLRTESPLWKKGDVKIEFSETAYDDMYITAYYMANKSKQGTKTFVKDDGLLSMTIDVKDDNPLEISFIRNYPKQHKGNFFSTFPSKGKKDEAKKETYKPTYKPTYVPAPPKEKIIPYVPEFKTEKRKCFACDGTGMIDCINCDGMGRQQCSYCRGSGEGFDCVSCNGTGLSECSACDGTGRGSFGGKCYSCGGKGFKKCYLCNGRGHSKCYTCGGSGFTKCYSCNGRGHKKCYSCDGKGYH